MIRKMTAGVSLACVGIIAYFAMAGGQEPMPQRGNMFMLAKLEHAKSVLEGLTTENFELIAKHSQAMGLLSHEQGWHVLQTEEYLQRSVEFRRSIDALTEAAKRKNLDGATVAYVDATLKCVECHKYVRRIRQAARDISPTGAGRTLIR